MFVYQIYARDYDHSWDNNDILPTDILFDNEEKAKAYIEKNGGDYYTVEIQ